MVSANNLGLSQAFLHQSQWCSKWEVNGCLMGNNENVYMWFSTIAIVSANSRIVLEVSIMLLRVWLCCRVIDRQRSLLDQPPTSLYDELRVLRTRDEIEQSQAREASTDEIADKVQWRFLQCSVFSHLSYGHTPEGCDLYLASFTCLSWALNLLAPRPGESHIHR